VRGLARKIGMSCPEVPGATGDLATSYEAKAEAAFREAETHDLVMVHVAAVNEASRVHDARAKVRALTRLDRTLVAPLVDWVARDAGARRLLVTSDHQTSVDPGVAEVVPVPFAVYGAGIEGVRSRAFTEKSAASSDLILPDAGTLLDFFLGSRARAAVRSSGSARDSSPGERR
jgi:2,3-bisphosphoglycerate-independent phosphoglycerate mutase